MAVDIPPILIYNTHWIEPIGGTNENSNRQIKRHPLYRQIAEQIQAQIISREIPDGFQFPSERQLADTLGINRTTVLNAYKELKADGLLASHGKGTVAVREEEHQERRTDYRKEPMWSICSAII